MKICVVALGKIGLPLAVQFAGMGHQVVGVDVNATLVATVNRGEEPFPGEFELAERLSGVVANGTLRATTYFADSVPQADVVVVVVPLFTDTTTGAPQFDWMDQATTEIARNMSANTLVLYETTLPVGTTRTRWKPMLETFSGMVEGRDFDVAFSPERVLTGRIFLDLRRYPKLVGGLSDHGTAKAIDFYRQVLEFDLRPDLVHDNGVWDMGSAEAAELAKLAETTYRDVNIGLANQFAQFAGEHGIDIHTVIDASNSQPFSHIHRPGIAVGGHCIPVYPWLYMWTDSNATIVRAARAANLGMPAYAVDLLVEEFGPISGRRVVVLGAAYRGGVKETAFSGVFPVVEALTSAGAIALVHDPMFSDAELMVLGFVPYHLGEPADAAIVQADHAMYGEIGATDLPGVVVLLDGRRISDPARWPGVRRRVLGVG